MGGPKRVLLAVGLVLLVLAAVLSIWFISLKPEVREIIVRNVFEKIDAFSVGRDDLGAPFSDAVKF